MHQRVTTTTLQKVPGHGYQGEASFYTWWCLLYPHHLSVRRMWVS